MVLFHARDKKQQIYYDSTGVGLIYDRLDIYFYGKYFDFADTSNRAQREVQYAYLLQYLCRYLYHNACTVKYTATRTLL
jgi:hypothetical protein